MKELRWNSDKNEAIRKERKVSFEEVALAVEMGKLLDIVKHPNQKKYLNQRMLVVEIRNYAYLVPFVEETNYIFLKTIFPSRKATDIYIKLRPKNEKD